MTNKVDVALIFHVSCCVWIDNRSKSPLKRLETLDLSRNSFDQSIMEFLGGITSLKNLILSDNDISGLFPSKGTNVSNYIFHTWNFNLYILIFNICSELSLLRKLQLLDLSYNPLRGSLKGTSTSTCASHVCCSMPSLGSKYYFALLSY